MMSQDWLGMTASDLGRGIAAGRIDPLALTETHLEAIDRHPARDRIYAAVTPARARAEAQAAAARARAGTRRGPLDGVPVSWKDLFDSAGTETAAGSRLLAGRVPEADAAVLRAATAAGLVCLGKTHMSELAFSGLGYNPMTGTPPNVNDPAAAPGGSSSGAAASVAFGLAAAGIGSDTGGSVRIPAAWNDLVGLKTTPGRLSLEGVVPLAQSFDTVGPLCRSVEDAAHLLAALEGGRSADLAGATLQGTRLLVLQNVVLDDLRPEPRAAYEHALARFRAAGATLVERELPEVSEATLQTPYLFTAEAYGYWRETIEAAPDRMFPQILERFRSGGTVLAADYVAAWNRLHALRARYLDSTAGFDAVVVPTNASLPPAIDRLRTDDAYYVAENLMALRNTRVGNLMGLPGLTLPAGTKSCGISLLAAPMQEERLLRLGAAAERALG
jgi:aspartyl-tRNA(Asn)/glutamyl-tRNA(Gln) amidotransferase subunit A